MITVALFSVKAGVGATTLNYHLAHMFPRLGYRVLAVDLDPQADLSSMFFDEETLEPLWAKEAGSVCPIDAVPGLSVICAQPELARFEDGLAESWIMGLAGNEAALQDTAGFYRMIQEAGKSQRADIALLDIGPNLGAISRAALLAVDYLLIPLVADLRSLNGVKALGATLSAWRHSWRLLGSRTKSTFELPRGQMWPLGYVTLRPTPRTKWQGQAGDVYRRAISDGEDQCLAALHNYQSLILMAQQARKPMFDLTVADGALGSHAQLVRVCEQDFRNLAEKVAQAAGLAKPSP